MFFLLKSDVNGELEKVLVHLKEKMKVYCDDFDVTKSEPPSKVGQFNQYNVMMMTYHSITVIITYSYSIY